MEEDVEELKVCLRKTLHYLATAVNGDDEDVPNFWENAKNQVLEGRVILRKWEEKVP